MTNRLGSFKGWHSAVWLLIPVICGCVSADIAPPKDDVERIARVHIVVMEPRPLSVHPSLRSTILNVPGNIQTARGVGVVNTIAMFLEIPEAAKRGAEMSGSLQQILSSDGVWIPTVALANEVSRQLDKRGFPTTLSPTMREIPGIEDRSVTYFMQNWLAPIRAWYDDAGPIAGYDAQVRDPSAYVLEVGILTYELAGPDMLTLWIMLKLVDPSTGKVVGRASALRASTIPPVNEAFANNGARFKEAFIDRSRPLVAQCLTELGFSR